MNNTYGKLMGWFGFILTLIKPIFGSAVVYLIITQSPRAAAIGIFSIVVADIFDGVLFRASPLVARYTLGRVRRIADAVGDRLVVQAVLITLVFFAGMPVGFYIAATARELVAIAIVSYSQLTKQSIKEPNMASRLAVACQGVMAIFWLVGGFRPTLAISVLLVAFGLTGIWQYYQSARKAPEPASIPEETRQLVVP